jgi:hypothetical protein
MSKILNTTAAIIMLGLAATSVAQARAKDHDCRPLAQAQTQAPHYTMRYYGGPKSPMWPSFEPEPGVVGLACNMPFERGLK